MFSTCTLLPEENEEQVAWALQTFPELTLVDQVTLPYISFIYCLNTKINSARLVRGCSYAVPFPFFPAGGMKKLSYEHGIKITSPTEVARSTGTLRLLSLIHI